MAAQSAGARHVVCLSVTLGTCSRQVEPFHGFRPEASLAASFVWWMWRAFGVERPRTQACGEEVGQRNEDGRFNKACPGTFVGARESGRVASSVLENTQRSLNVMWSENEPKSWWRYWIRQMWLWGCLYVFFFFFPFLPRLCLCALFKCGSSMESFCSHISLESLIRHGQRHGNRETERLLGKEADSTSGRFCNAIFRGGLTKY